MWCRPCSPNKNKPQIGEPLVKSLSYVLADSWQELEKACTPRERPLKLFHVEGLQGLVFMVQGHGDYGLPANLEDMVP